MSQACRCSDPPTWMQLITAPKAAPPKFDRIVIPMEDEPSPARSAPTGAADRRGPGSRRGELPGPVVEASDAPVEVDESEAELAVAQGDESSAPSLGDREERPADFEIEISVSETIAVVSEEPWPAVESPIGSVTAEPVEAEAGDEDAEDESEHEQAPDETPSAEAISSGENPPRRRRGRRSRSKRNRGPRPPNQRDAPRGGPPGRSHGERHSGGDSPPPTRPSDSPPAS